MCQRCIDAKKPKKAQRSHKNVRNYGLQTCLYTLLILCQRISKRVLNQIIFKNYKEMFYFYQKLDHRHMILFILHAGARGLP